MGEIISTIGGADSEAKGISRSAELVTYMNCDTTAQGCLHQAENCETLSLDGCT